MAWQIDPKFSIPINRDVVRFVQETNPSAHSDVGSELIDAIEGLPGVGRYCPNPSSYAFIWTHTKNNRVFGLAYGMSGFCLRVGADAAPQAIADGARAFTEAGADWVVLDPFPPGLTRTAAQAKLRAWTVRAYYHVAGLE